VLQEAGMTILISSHVLSDLAELCTSVGIMGYLVRKYYFEGVLPASLAPNLFINFGELEELDRMKTIP